MASRVRPQVAEIGILCELLHAAGPVTLVKTNQETVVYASQLPDA